MEYNERNITEVEVYKELQEVQKELKETKEQNKEILAKLESMQEIMKESNATFHTSFATVFEALQDINEVKQNEDCVDMLKAGSVANLICAEQWRRERTETAKADKNKEEKKTVVVKKVSEEKAKDIIDFLKMLKSI